MSPALNRSSEIQCFENSDAIEICNGIIFDFHPGLPHIAVFRLVVADVHAARHLPSLSRLLSSPPLLLPHQLTSESLEVLGQKQNVLLHSSTKGGGGVSARAQGGSEVMVIRFYM